MQKTLLDEFAMASLTGWLATFHTENGAHSEQLASFCYDQAEAMMAEREKRLQERPQQEEPKPFSDAQGFTSQGLSVEYLLSTAKQNAGKRMTATEVYHDAYGVTEKPSINELRDIGMLLRQHGYQCRRSGGKDYYQL